MSQLKRQKFEYGLLESEAPSEKIISEGDLLIKRLSEKQRNTEISLQEQLTKPKQFIKGSEVLSLSRYRPGTSSLSEVITSTQHFDVVEHLKGAGLSEQEVELYLDNLNGFEFVCNKHRNWEKGSLRRYLEYIKDLVDKYKTSTELLPDQNELRHKTVEYGLTIKPDSIQTKLLRFALHNHTNSKSQVPQAIDNIEDIERNRFQNSNEQPIQSVNKIRRKARKLQNRLMNLAQSSPAKSDNIIPQTNSKWDVKEHCEESSVKTIQKMYTCTPINYYTIKNNEIIKFGTLQERVKANCRLTLEEIKLLPKFNDYVPGNPSNVLYLKNLANKVKEENLKQLFRKHDCNIMDYKILHGKLRGQAFITFSNVDGACTALEETNGTFIKNKPVIIQFSNKT